jgi:uncharacterized protein (DUF2267 family)
VARFVITLSVMAIDGEALLDEVMWRGGIHDRARAQAAVDAALDAAAQHLGAPERAFIAGQLPARLAAAAQQPTPAAALRPGDLYAQLATTEEISLGLAIEHAKAACSSLAEFLDGEARALLARRLPRDWAALFAPVSFAAEADVPAGTVPGHGHTLATGRPGSRRPLAEAGLRAGQADSIATADNPHGDDKLSSAREVPGTNPLSTARPGAGQQIAEAKDERR